MWFKTQHFEQNDSAFYTLRLSILHNMTQHFAHNDSAFCTSWLSVLNIMYQHFIQDDPAFCTLWLSIMQIMSQHLTQDDPVIRKHWLFFSLKISGKWHFIFWKQDDLQIYDINLHHILHEEISSIKELYKYRYAAVTAPFHVI